MVRPVGSNTDQAITNRRKRFERIEQLLALHYSDGQVASRVSEEFNVSRRQIHYDIAKYVAKLVANDEPIEVKRKKMRKSLEALYRSCIKANDRRAAAMVQDRISKLEGLDAAMKVAVSVSGTVNIHVCVQTSPASRTRMEELLKMAGQLPPDVIDAECVDVPTVIDERPAGN